MTSEVTVPEAAIIAMRVEARQWDEGLDTRHRDRMFKVYRDDELISEHPDRASMLEALDNARARAALTAALPHLSTAIRDAALETVAVPKVALDWLMGAGPDPAGLWFGDFPEGYPPPPGAFWWRTTFKEICAYASSNARKSIPAPAEGNEAEAPAPAQAPGELVERLALAEMILAHTEDPALAPVAAALSAAIAALSQEQRGAVEVKPLEWEDADEGLCTKWRAAALGGNYELITFDGEVGFAVNFHWGRPLSFWFIQGKPDEWGPTGPQMFPTLNAAKAAAQADYEARVMSALAATPVHQEAGK